MTRNGANLPLAEKIQKLIEEKRDKSGAGASFAFIKGGRLAAACTAGVREEGGEPVQVGDLFNIGSVSKVYCAMALVKLAEQGKAGLDDPVCKHLPRFTMRDPRYKDITLRMCVNHTSGLPGTMFSESFCTQWQGDAFYGIFYDYLAKSKLKSDPGSAATYCNDGFTLAEMAGAVISGMSYTAFVQEYITRPLGALSTCSPENNPENRFRVHGIGKPVEALSVVGAGGISTDITDCALFGDMFLRPGEVFTPAGIAEAVEPQRKAWPGGDFFDYLGLGWDSVAFAVPGYDLGEGVLMKSGGTLQFSTYLMVSKKHDFAAAMSATGDCKIDVMDTLCQLCAVAMDAFDTDIRLKADEPEPQKLPRPADWEAKYAGVYANNGGLFKALPAEDGVTLTTYKNGEWTDVAANAVWDGEFFVHAAMRFRFFSSHGTEFIAQKNALGSVAFAQRPGKLPSPNPKWDERLGKKFILAGGSASDMVIGGMFSGGLTVGREGDILLFTAYGDSGPVMNVPAACAGPDDTDMFLNVSGGSRDTYGFFAYEKDGAEYLEGLGFVFVEESALSVFDPSKDAGKSGTYRLEAAVVPAALIQPGMRTVVLNAELSTVFDGLTQGAKPEPCDGYVIFLA